MATDAEALIPIRGVDRATPAAEAADGSCLAIENLVPVGPSDNPYWSVVTDFTDQGVGNILSLGRQTRNEFGALADSNEYPNVQSLDRLVAVKADGVYVIDPSNSYAEAKVFDFGNSDSTRRATFSEAGTSVFISVTIEDNNDVRVPDQFLELRDDTVSQVQWVPPPILTVSWNGQSSDNFLDEGTGDAAYVFRYAWRLTDGSIGPASIPCIEETPTGSTSYRPTFEVPSYDEGIGAIWRQKAAELVIIGHAPAKDDNGNVTSKAIRQPGHIIGTVDYDPGSTFTFEEKTEDVLADEVYDNSTLLVHQRRPGAQFSYNERLILGDIQTDFYRPNARKLLKWEEGVDDDGTGLHWVMIEVEIETSIGTVKRYSQPLPYENSTSSPTAAESVDFRKGVLAYRDPRAGRVRVLVSTDYTENDSLSSATWTLVPLSTVDERLKDAPGASYAYLDVRSEGAVDVTDTDPAAVPAIVRFGDDDFYGARLDPDDDGTNEWVKTGTTEEATWAYVEAEEREQSGSNDTDEDILDAELNLSKVLGSGEDLLAVTQEYWLSLDVDGDDSYGEIEYTFEILDSGRDVLYDFTTTIEQLAQLRIANDGGSNWTPADAEYIQIYLRAYVNVDSQLFDAESAEAIVNVQEMALEVDSEVGTDISVTSGRKKARSPNSITWSEVNRPIDRPAKNVVYAGESNADPVIALTSVGKTVSEGQYGQYPIIAFSQQSVRLLQVGGDPFIEGVSPVTGEMGLVGRRAFANTDGIVTAAMDRGVYQFTPNLEQPALSEPLHDVRDSFLGDLQADTAVGFYAEEDRGRKEIWVAGNNTTWVYSISHGVWSQLSRQRVDFARLSNTLRGVGTDNDLHLEGGADSEVPFTVVTGLVHFGEVGYLERLKELYIRQRFMMESMDWKLVTKDPNAAQALKSGPLNRATLPGGLTARDLLPNVLIESGTLNRGDLGTIHLPKALGYSWFLRLEGSGKPDQGLEGFGATIDAKRRVRPRAFFPDQPETVILSFDVEPDDSSDLTKIEILDSTGSEASNIAAILWGDGTSDSSPDVTHTYDSGGTYTVQVVAQPDFEEAVTFNLGGPIDASTYATSDLIDLVEQRFDFSADAIKQPFNSPETGFFDNGTELFTSDTEIDVHLPDVPDRYTKVWLNDSPAYGDFSPPADAEEVILSSTNTTGETTQSKTPNDLRRLNIPKTDITINESALAAACASTFRSLRIDNGVNKQNEKWNWDVLLEQVPDLVEIRGGGQPEPSIAGTDTNGEPYIKSNLEQLSTQDAEYVLGGATDFSKAKSLFRLVLRKNYRTSPVPFNSGEGYDEILTDLHANRNVPPGGFDYTDLSLDIREHCGSVPTANDPLVFTETLSQDSVNKALGLGAYHPSNGGEGLLDAGIAVDSRALYECETLTYVDDTTLTCDIPLRAQHFETVLNEEFRESGGKLQVRTTQSDDPNNRDVVWEDVFQDGAGQQLRVFDKGNLSDLGLFEIQSATIDKSAERMTINVVSGPLPDPLPGTLFTGRTWPTPAYCTP